MKLRNILKLIIILPLFASQLAYSNFDGTLVGILTLSNYSTNPSLTGQGVGVNFGGAGFLGYNFENSPFGAELGFSVVGRSITIAPLGISETYNFAMIEIPLLVRYTPYIFLLEAGPYVGFGIASGIQNQFNGAYASLAAPSTDVGIKIGAGVQFPVRERILIRGEALFTYGFANITNQTGYTFMTRSFDIFAGATYLFDFSGMERGRY